MLWTMDAIQWFRWRVRGTLRKTYYILYTYISLPINETRDKNGVVSKWLWIDMVNWQIVDSSGKLIESVVSLFTHLNFTWNWMGFDSIVRLSKTTSIYYILWYNIFQCSRWQSKNGTQYFLASRICSQLGETEHFVEHIIRLGQVFLSKKIDFTQLCTISLRGQNFNDIQVFS